MSDRVVIELLPHGEKLAADNRSSFMSMLLYHQWRTYKALQDHPLVVNTHDTGTGKTFAALLHLCDAVPQRINTLLIAPTNELIRQHVRDTQGFLQRANLHANVLHVDAPTLHSLSSPREYERRGERLVRLFQNPRDYGWDGQKPIVVVTNPDIFYYALYYSAYHPHDQRNLFQQFLTRFDYVIVDEFHYYSAKQLANFLFFFVICREWGYLDAGRRICLLSATPDARMREYLERVLTATQIAWITPDNEPAESATYPTTPALAPLTLGIQTATLDEFAASASNRAQLRDWLESGREGALISNALWRINQARAKLRGPGLDGCIGRITGAEMAESRRAASTLPLILATPTVDLGYNFDRPGKTRQPMDFVIFDARSRDAFLQRLGRAGRVLNRVDTDVSSNAVALVDDEAQTALSRLNGQTITRAQFKAHVNQALPPRNDLYAYLRSYAILEAFWPIHQLERQMGADMHAWIERLFDSVRETFAPDSHRWYFGTLSKQMRRFAKLGEIVHGKRHEYLHEFIEEYVDWLRPALDDASEANKLLLRLHNQESARMRLLLPWAESQYWQTQALFSFRDAYQSPMACVHDPAHLLGDTSLIVYDALHVATNFEADYFADRDAFAQATQIHPETADVYCHLRAHRKQRLRTGFDYSPKGLSRDAFEALYCRRPVAMRDLTLYAELPTGGLVPLHPTLRQAFEQKHVPVLLVKSQDRGRLLLLLRDRNVFARTVRVTFSDGTQNEYLALVGTAVFVVHAELEGYLWWREKQEDRKPIFA